jgi:hypothetical protein
MSVRPLPITIAFYVAFAMVFTATRYSGPGFYGSLFGQFFQGALGLLLLGIVCAVLIGVGRRSLRTKSFPLVDLVWLGGAVLVLDLFWRLYLSPHAWDAFKLTSVVLDAAQPLVGVLGLISLVAEWKRPQQLAA